jgi:endothelin-converting enzyme/putative endopeptidase
MHKVLTFFLSLCLIGAAAAALADPQKNAGPLLGEWGLETQYFSESVAPGDDFFTYVNEGWIKQAKFPPGMPKMDSFTEVFLRTEGQIQDIMDDLLVNAKAGDAKGQQLANLYKSYMDTSRIEALGITPLKADLADILAIARADEVARWMAKPQQDSVIGTGVDLDQKAPEHYVLYLGQSGLGLPGREFYLNDEAPFPETRKAYVSYIESLFSKAGIDRADERANDILSFETAIAQRHWTPAQNRDRLKNYNPMTRKELIAFAPGFAWQEFLDESKLGDQDKFIVRSDSAIKETAALMADTPLDTLRSYLAFHFINNQAPYLSQSYRDASFDFFQRTLQGIEEQRPRELSALNYVSSNLGEVLGQIYVERYFPPENKAMMEQYIHFIREAFRQRIAASNWMDAATKKEAFAKLDGFVAKIGYPDQWQDFSSVEIKPDDLLGNNRRIQEWYNDDALAKLTQPRRHWEWMLDPQIVNAYYSASRNEIVFPAAILQPPFFDPNADPAANFAAIGAVIGHEMGHGFDDQGSRSDGDGVIRDWWTDESRKHFEEQAQGLVEQYSVYEPITGTNINGQLTLGENIGDLGGLSIAFHAYQNFLKDSHDGAAPIIDGLTGEQRFFMAWAQLWRTIQTEDSLRNRLLTAPHSPGEYRVNGVIRNMDAWYEAFDVTPEHELFLPPEQRISIW